MGQQDMNYESVMSGYANQLADYKQRYADINSKYNQLFKQQSAYGAAAQNALDRQYGAQAGATQQSLVSRGLGNTTVLDSAQRGLTYDKASAGLQLNDFLLNRQNQIVQGQLGYMANAQQGIAGIYGAQLGWQGGVAQQQDMLARQQANQLQLQAAQTNNQLELQRNQQRFQVLNQPSGYTASTGFAGALQGSTGIYGQVGYTWGAPNFSALYGG